MGDDFLDCLLLLYMEGDILQERIVNEAIVINRFVNEEHIVNEAIVINRFKAVGPCGKCCLSPSIVTKIVLGCRLYCLILTTAILFVIKL